MKIRKSNKSQSTRWFQLKSISFLSDVTFDAKYRNVRLQVHYGVFLNWTKKMSALILQKHHILIASVANMKRNPLKITRWQSKRVIKLLCVCVSDLLVCRRYMIFVCSGMYCICEAAVWKIVVAREMVKTKCLYDYNIIIVSAGFHFQGQYFKCCQLAIVAAINFISLCMHFTWGVYINSVKHQPQFCHRRWFLRSLSLALAYTLFSWSFSNNNRHKNIAFHKPRLKFHLISFDLNSLSSTLLTTKIHY